MELETRVKTLEHEIKILKNDVQNILLEIQEQVLNHYYPALRAEEVAPAENQNPRQSLAALLSENGNNGNANTNGNGNAIGNGNRETREKAMPRRARQNHAEEAPANPRRSGASAKGRFAPQPEPEIDWDTWTTLGEWMNDSLARLGTKGTRKVIELYANRETLDPEIEEILLQLLSLGDEVDAPARSGMKEVLSVLQELKSVIGELSG